MIETQGITFGAAFLAGLFSFISPCVLPLVPAYLSFISGLSVDELKSGASRKNAGHTMARAAAFVAGFGLVFVLFGASATWVGRLLNSQSRLFEIVSGTLIFILGLHLTGIFRIPFLMQTKSVQVGRPAASLFSAFVVGLAFAFGWSPCVGPILAGVLALAGTQETVWQGVMLLTVYSLGLGVPFLLTAWATQAALSALARIKPYFRVVEWTAGGLLMVMGGLIATHRLGVVAGWFAPLAKFAM